MPQKIQIKPKSDNNYRRSRVHLAHRNGVQTGRDTGDVLPLGAVHVADAGRRGTTRGQRAGEEACRRRGGGGGRGTGTSVYGQDQVDLQEEEEE